MIYHTFISGDLYDLLCVFPTTNPIAAKCDLRDLCDLDHHKSDVRNAIYSKTKYQMLSSHRTI